MAKRRSTRKNRNSRKNSRKNRSRNTRNRRMFYGGQAPVDWSNPEPMKLNLAQGNQFLGFHPGFRAQQGGFVAPYPGGVTESVSPMTADPSSRVAPLTAAFQEIAGLKDQAGGRRRSRKGKGRKGKGRKGRKGSRKQRGGDFVRWGGGGCGLMKGGQRGGSAVTLNPTEVAASGEMLLPQDYANKAAGLNNEWNLAKDPMAFAPK